MKWVTMWGNAQSTAAPHPAQYAKDVTLRYPLFVPFDGNKIRINLDNFCLNEEVKIENVYVSHGHELSDVSEDDFIPVTFNGKTNLSIEAHQNVTSDEIEIELRENSYLIVSIYLSDYVKLTGGVDVRGPLTKAFYAYGNQATNTSLDINKYKSTNWFYFLANVDIYTDDNNKALICYGDSITSQNWPDEMMLALREKGINNISVIRKAVSGTRILRQYECIIYQSYGLNGYHRFVHEVSSVSGAYAIIVQHGINDIIHPVGEDVNIYRPMSDLPTKDELIEGINYYKEEAEKLNLKFYVGTLLPIFDWRTYAPFREILKNDFNDELRKNYDVIDFEEAIGYNLEDVWYFKEGCDSGDHLHPSKLGYKIMGIEAAKKIS